MRSTSQILASLAFLTGSFLFANSSFAVTNIGTADREATVNATFPTPREIIQEGLNPHVDMMFGLMNPEGSYNSSAEFGFGFGFQPYIPFGLGMTLTHAGSTGQKAGMRNLERTAVLVNGTYHFAGEIPVIKHSHVGFATGPIMNQDATYFALGPIVGFDIPVQEWSGEYLSYMTIGMDAKYLLVSSSESNSASINAALKYWF